MSSTFSRRIRFVLICVCLSGCLISCEKEKLLPVDETAARIEGTYVLSEITWTGEPVDVNGDGVASTILYEEMMSLPTNAENRFLAEVLPVSSDHQDGAIVIQLPIQNVSATYDGRYPTAYMIGNTLPLRVKYWIDANGNLSVEPFKSFDVTPYELRVEIKSIHDGKVSFDRKNMLLFTADYTLYDHKAGQLCEGIIEYIYKKIVSR